MILLAQTDEAPSDPGAPPAAAPGAGNGEATNTSTTGEEMPPADQTGSTQQPANGQGGGDGGLFGGGSFLLILVLMIVVMYVFIFGSQRKEKKKRAEMLDQLSKNDKVITIGGIVGTVVEVKPSEIVLKVDESSNTRMKFARTAIQQVVSDEKDKGNDNKD